MANINPTPEMLLAAVQSLPELVSVLQDLRTVMEQWDFSALSADSLTQIDNDVSALSAHAVDQFADLKTSTDALAAMIMALPTGWVQNIVQGSTPSFPVPCINIPGLTYNLGGTMYSVMKGTAAAVNGSGSLACPDTAVGGGLAPVITLSATETDTPGPLLVWVRDPDTDVMRGFVRFFVVPNPN